MGMLNVAEVLAMRPEDINARQVQQAFADGATLAELEEHLAFLRSLGAPDDAHPRTGAYVHGRPRRQHNCQPPRFGREDVDRASALLQAGVVVRADVGELAA